MTVVVAPPVEAPRIGNYTAARFDTDYYSDVAMKDVACQKSLSLSLSLFLPGLTRAIIIDDGLLTQNRHVYSSSECNIRL